VGTLTPHIVIGLPVPTKFTSLHHSACQHSIWHCFFCFFQSFIKIMATKFADIAKGPKGKFDDRIRTARSSYAPLSTGQGRKVVVIKMDGVNWHITSSREISQNIIVMTRFVFKNAIHQDHYYAHQNELQLLVIQLSPLLDTTRASRTYLSHNRYVAS
jgi:hypothetical protein